MCALYDYRVIANFNLNIRIERFRLISVGDEEPLRLQSLPYSQVRITMAEMEAILKAANTVADNVTLFYKTDPNEPTLSPEEAASTHSAITVALKTLLANVDDPDFQSQIRVIHEADPNNRTTGLNSYHYTEIADGFETIVYLTYMPNIFSTTLIYPERPGAIINHFNEMTY